MDYEMGDLEYSGTEAATSESDEQSFNTVNTREFNSSDKLKDQHLYVSSLKNDEVCNRVSEVNSFGGCESFPGRSHKTSAPISGKAREKIPSRYNVGVKAARKIASVMNNTCSKFTGYFKTVPENEKQEPKISETEDARLNSPDERKTENSFNLCSDPRLNTLEDSIKCFGLTGDMERLEKSLEDVKRNKIDKQDHEDNVKTIDKKIQKLSTTFHPDRVRNRGRSDEEVAAAQQLQAALNATRTVLKVLSEVFLENIDIDYKYKYFAKFEICSLVNESEIDHRINDVLYHISELSEIKQIKIIRQIWKFLIETQKCVESYLDNNKRDFAVFRDSALSHLCKCIDGHEKLVAECNELVKGCGDQTEANIRSVINEVAEQCWQESEVLSRLLSLAEDSIQNKFQIFPTCKTMDDYYVLPFVCYVNILLMCNAMMFEEKKRFCLFSETTPKRPDYEDEHISYTNLYGIVCNFKFKNVGTEVKNNSGKEAVVSSKIGLKQEFEKTLKEVMKIFAKQFPVDAYKEGRSNRMHLIETLSKLKETMADIKQRERNLNEKVKTCEMKSDKNWAQYHQIKKEGAEVGRKVHENLVESENVSETFSNLLLLHEQNKEAYQKMFEKDRELNRNSEMKEKIEKYVEEEKKNSEQISDLITNCKQSIPTSRIFQNEVGKEMAERLERNFEGRESNNYQFPEFLAQSMRNITERTIEKGNNEEIWRNADQVVKGKIMEERLERNFEGRESNNYEFLAQSMQNITERTIEKGKNEEIWRNADQVVKGKIMEERLKRNFEGRESNNYQFPEFGAQTMQNITERTIGIGKSEENCRNSDQDVKNKILEEKFQETFEDVKEFRKQLSELSFPCMQNRIEDKWNLPETE